MFLLLRWAPSRLLRKAGGVTVLLTFSLLGTWLVYERKMTNDPAHLVHLKQPAEFYVANIRSYAHERENSWRHTVAVERVRVGREWKNVTGTIYLYQRKEEAAKPFRYGDRLLIQGHPQAIAPPANPGEFDYKRFLSFRQIFHQHAVAAHQVQWIENAPASRLLALAIRIRTSAEEVIRVHIRAPREQAVAHALVLGITDGLDNQLTHAYAATGAMHVLAVSGLHVGIIYGILLLLLRPLQHRKGGIVFTAVVSVVVLWLYAMVTGLSPSVLRAVTMFSFVALARPFGQQTNTYNTLAAAAFCLLLVDPLMIMSVGFQLSFLAVLGIVFIHPIIYSRWEPANYWVDQVWNVTCVSLAAQLATFSLGLLYFHQFPNYFLFSNLVVIPGSFAVLVGGLLLLAVAPVAFISTWLGVALEKLIWGLNGFVLWVESWPFGLTDNVYISTGQSWWLLGLIVCLVLLIQFGKTEWLYGALICSLLFVAANWARFFDAASPTVFTVYSVKKHAAYDFIHRGTAYVWMDSALQRNPSRARFHLRPQWLRAAVNRVQPVTHWPAFRTEKGVAWMVREGRTIIHLTEKNFELPREAVIDFLVVSNNAINEVAQVPSGISVKHFIVDTSCSPRLAARLVEQGKERGWQAHNIFQGYFQTTL